jgi:hypothetical protein
MVPTRVFLVVALSVVIVASAAAQEGPIVLA